MRTIVEEFTNSKHTISPSRQINVLAVGRAGTPKRQWPERLFHGSAVQIAPKSLTLLEALARLESEAIDLVLVEGNFREAERSLFVLEAKRRGFGGLILYLQDRAQAAPSPSPEDKRPVQVGEFTIHSTNRRIWLKGRELQLSPQEFELLHFFCENPEELLTHEVLSETIQGDSAVSQETLRVIVRSVRSKIESSTTTPRYILTHRGFGYRFIPAPPPIQ
jgi:DNA-binding winged helix-turn-helix (wHTH) protein